jgi:uncharacterized membrane protein
MNVLSIHTIGRIFFGLAISGIGFSHFFIPGFPPDILPVPAAATLPIFPFMMGIVLTVAGILVVANKWTRTVSLSLGFLFLLFLLFGHLPVQLTSHPEQLRYWTPTVKLLALTGGAFVLSRVSTGPAFMGLDKIANYGEYFFAVQLINFGIAHFVYAAGLQNIIPAWMPAHLFWVYATGIAMAGAGLSIFINFRQRLVMLLLAAMFFTWLLILHIPSVIKNPFGSGALVISSFQCLAACGVALLISTLVRQREGIVPRTAKLSA